MLISGLDFASLLGLLWILGGVVVVSCLVVSIFFISARCVHYGLGYKMFLGIWIRHKGVEMEAKGVKRIHSEE